MLVAKAPSGIIDTLSEGFLIVHRRLWVLLLPVILDLLLAFGPGVSPTPLVDRAVALLQQPPSETTAGLPPDEVEGTLSQLSDSVSKFRDTNLLGVLAWQLPSIVSATGSTPLPPLRGPVIATISDGWSLAGWLLGLGALSLLGASVYLTALAQPLRTRASLLRQALRGWINFILLYIGLTLVALPAGMFLVVLLAVTNFISPGLLSFSSGIVFALIMLAGIYLFFADDAIFVANAPAWRAVSYSVRVVWKNFWPAVGFILLVNLILVGTPLAWRLIIENPVGILAAIAGHAYIATGLAAGGMIFLRQRLPTIGS